MRKKTFGIFIFFASITSLYSQNYSIKGKTGDLYNGKKIYIQELTNDRNGLVNTDSTVVKNNQFDFPKLETNSSNLKFVTSEIPSNYPPLIFIPEGEVVEISLVDSPKIGGTPKNENLQKFMSKQDSLQSKIQSIVDYYKTQNQTSENYTKRVELMNPLIEEMAESRYNFAMENIQSDLGEFVAITSFDILPAERILELMNATRPQFKESKIGKEIVQYFEAENSKIPGQAFKDLELTNLEGQKVKLSDFAGKGKYVLVDFWASWCGPCIKEMPLLKEAYEKYKNKGLEIVGVSLDDNKEAWQKAVNKLNIVWPQMSDLKGWKSDAALAYGINSIPFTLLIDKDGNIITSNLRGEELTNELNKLIK